jgi:hypothetical protein
LGFPRHWRIPGERDRLGRCRRRPAGGFYRAISGEFNFFDNACRTAFSMTNDKFSMTNSQFKLTLLGAAPPRRADVKISHEP